MRSNPVSKSQSAEILGAISGAWGIELPRTKNLMVYYVDDDSQIISGDGFTAVKSDGAYLPFLAGTGILERFPSVTVDMGAVRFMCNGANLMRPGIVSNTDFERGQIVCIVEESKHKFLAVGTATVSSAELESMQKGEVVKNRHYISDRFWEAGKTIS